VPFFKENSDLIGSKSAAFFQRIFFMPFLLHEAQASPETNQIRSCESPVKQ